MSKAEILIELVKRFPILYDFSHEDHKNSWKKKKIWDEIGKEINETGEEAKKSGKISETHLPNLLELLQ